MAAYLTLLLCDVASFCVGVVASTNLAVHRAFAAGLITGQASVWDPETEPNGKDPLLRLVE